MGGQCMRPTQSYHSHQLQQRYYSLPKKPLKGSQITINLCSWFKGQSSKSLKQNGSLFYSAKLDDNQNCVKYVPNVGFTPFNMATQDKITNNQIMFQLSKAAYGQSQIAVTVPSRKQIWKKIQNFGTFIKQRSSIKVGKMQLIFKGLLNHCDILQTQKGNKAKILYCQQPHAQCRFCLQPNTDPENPLIIPCKCTGSLNAVHQRCLSKWIFNYQNILGENMNQFRFQVKHFQCQICKNSFIDYIWYRLMLVLSTNPGTYTIFQIPQKPHKNSQQSQQKQFLQKQYVIFKFSNQKNSISLGKSAQCDMVIQDMNIGQVNTLLVVNDGKLMVKDNHSRYGTFISMQQQTARKQEQAASTTATNQRQSNIDQGNQTGENRNSLRSKVQATKQTTSSYLVSVNEEYRIDNIYFSLRKK